MLVTAKPSYDSDASAYFTTAGVTSTAGRQQVSRFVTGIKDLGLWNSMVCWPLRSSQNAGTGTIAYSLGGLGTYNGALNGSPSWTSDGISLAVGDKSITATVPYGTTAGSLFGVVRINALSQVYLLLRNSTSGMGFFSPFSDNNLYFDYRESGNRLSVASGFTAGQYLMLAGYSGSTGSQIYRNTTSLATNTTAANGTGNTQYLARTEFSFGDQVVAFVMLMNSDARNSHSSIYSLFKSTLGQGLGLP